MDKTILVLILMTVTEILCKNLNNAFDTSENNDRWATSRYSKPTAELDASGTNDRFVSIATDLSSATTTATATNIVIDNRILWLNKWKIHLSIILNLFSFLFLHFMLLYFCWIIIYSVSLRFNFFFFFLFLLSGKWTIDSNRLAMSSIQMLVTSSYGIMWNVQLIQKPCQRWICYGCIFVVRDIKIVCMTKGNYRFEWEFVIFIRLLFTKSILLCLVMFQPCVVILFFLYLSTLKVILGMQ